MADMRENLLSNNQFLVSIGLLCYSFSKVTNISDSMEYESYQAGGRNSDPILLRKQKSRPEVLRLVQGVQTGMGGMKTSLLKTGVRVYGVNIMVMRNKKIAKIYFFEEGLITKWEVSDLDASGKDVLIRTMEIAHTGLTEVPVP